uniref:hypothetical chloroplast RF1 n=1 Tax=Gastrodia pubilabiata TaxID=1499945 RepID=UPI00286AF2DE|nr:hypothetical chloroplast RF1 [Gastrodia pubilabiata]WKV29267.1 hypothetical chloroplast RF1 [Gastrodia pubilabiata]
MKTSAILILVGLYYGFFTIFSIGPSFFFLIRYLVMEEGNEKEVSATTGFIAGQILNVLSIYYTPIYKILVRPHLITILVIPYIYFIIFYFNNKNDYYYIRSTSIHNLSIQFIFFNNLIYQLLNLIILPSSALNRLVNIYMFKYNKKILFLTSSFCGWLISHILFIKIINSIVFWIRHNYYRYKHNKYIITEFKNYINRIFNIFLFFICVSYLGRMPSPFFTRKLLDIEEVKIIEDEYSFERDYEINNRLEKDKMKINKIKFWFENIFVNFLFDYKRWNRPLRYIKNLQFDKSLRNEMSQFLFFTCTNDGNKRISFTYPYSLSIFLENIDKKLFNEYILNSWIYTNEKRMCKFNDEFKKRIKKIELKNNNNTEKYNIFEKRILLCDDKKQIKYLPNLYDPFFNGPNRININNMDTKSLSGIFLINNIYNILNNYYVKLSHNIIISYNMEKYILGYSENTIKYFKFLFDIIIAYEKKINNKYFIIRLNKIRKYIFRWSYKLKERLEEEEDYNEEEFEEEDIFDINSRKFKNIIIYKENNKDTNDTNDILISNNMEKKYRNEERIDEVTLIHYSNKSDFRRNLIKGSMRAQRRKIVIWDLFQVNVHSPLFLDRLTNSLINDLIFNKFKGIKKVKELHLIPYKLEKEHKYKDDQIEINENWDNPLFNQVIRSLMLVIQSYFRKYILLPLLIIVKNILRVLFFQIPEWDKDFKEWSKEMHIKCTYNGVQLSETEFPEDWLIDGIQIKILYPFCLKPFRKNKAISHNIKRPQSFFLTVWGGETDHIFGDPRKQSFIFNPIYKEIKKRVNRVNNLFLKIKVFLKVSKKKNKNNIFCESSILSQTTNISNIYLFQINIRDVYDKVFKIRKQTEQILKENNNIIQYYKDGVLQSYMYLWIILVKKNIRLIRKSYYFIKLFIEKLYIYSLLCIITFYKIKIKFFFYSSKYYFMKFNIYIYKEQDIFYEITKNTINFILIIKKILLNTKNITNKDPKFNSFLSYFSQAYVFYKLSRYQRLRLILIYKLRINTYVKNDWKIWFNLFFKSKIEEKDILKTSEWYDKNNKYYEYHLNQSKILIQTDKFIKDYYKLDYLVKKREKWTKNSRYDILLNQYIFNSYIDLSRLIIKIKNIRGDQEIEYDFNKQKYKSFFVYYLNRYIPYTTKKKNRDNNLNILYQKYLDYRIINSHLINYRNKNIIDIFNFKYWFFTEFFIYFYVYKEKPCLIPIKSLLFNISKRSDSTNKKIKISSNELYKKIIIYEDFIKLESKNSMEKVQYTNNREAELYYFLKNSLLFQLRWSDALNKRIIKNIKVYCLLLRLMNPKDIYISSIQRSEIKVDDMLIQKDLVIADFINNGIFIFEPIFISIRKGGEHIIYQALDISLNNKYIINNKYKNKINILFPENILSLERRREFRFRICLNYLNISNKNKKIYNDKKILLNSSKYLQANKYFTNFNIYFIYLNIFLWPNFRIEDISCINRYWFNINNSSRFSILKLYMYSKQINYLI